MDTPALQLTYNLHTINEAVKKLWDTVSGHKMFAFSGEMGAGKTTFIHNLCAYLQVEDRVSSPTFALINEYHFNDAGADATIYHTDWYRVKNTEEAISAGIEDCLEQIKNKNTYCFIEWPEKAPELLPALHVWLTIETISINERRMNVYVRGSATI